VRLLRQRLAAEVSELRVIDADLLKSRPGVIGVDPTHVLIETAPIGLTGYQATDWLRLQRHIDIELADYRRVMPLVSSATARRRSTGWCVPYATSLTNTQMNAATSPPSPAGRKSAVRRRCYRATRSSHQLKPSRSRRPWAGLAPSW
jgi:arginine/lysine/ornithine decarboxylase